MRNTVFQSNDWKVFLEGVEIPFISINVSSGKNGELSGSVEVQSSLLLMGLSPYAAIAIFFRDRAAPKKQQQSDVIERDYVLFAEGSVYEISTSKSADQRNTSLSFRGHLDTLIRHKKGNISRMSDDVIADISSSTYISTPNAQERTPVSEFLALIFPTDQSKFKRGSIPNRTDTDLSLLIMSLTSLLISANGACKNEANRTRLLDKFACMTDASLETVVRVETLQQLAVDTEQSASSNTSLLEILISFLNRFGYSLYSTTCPGSAQTNGSGQTELLSEDSFRAMLVPPGAISTNLTRNDFLVLPETYYLPPPPCNLIFPDSITSLSFSRDFDQEPTRSLMTLRGGLPSNQTIVFQSYKSTDDLEQSINAFMGNMLPSNTGELRTPTVGMDSDFNLEMFDNLNILKALSDDELTRGVVLNSVDPGPEFYFAAARAFFDEYASADQNFKNSTFAALLSIGKTAASATAEQLDLTRAAPGSKATRQDFITPFLESVEAGARQQAQKAYDKQIFDFNQQYLKFRHTIDMYTRQLNVVCRGLRWAVPGFSCVIFDKDACYIGKLEKTETSISAGGDERTVMQLSQVRELAPLDYTFESSTVFKFKRVEDLDYYQFPAPPPSAEFTYTSPQRLDKLYEQLLGCQKFYSSEAYGKGIKIADATDSKSSARNYLELLKVLARVFDGARKYAPSDTSFDAVSPSWDQQVLSGEDVTSWVEQSFHRRSAQTLENYLRANGFSPVLNSESPFNGAKFQRMVPAQITQAAKSKNYQFDNSIICRLVDGRSIAGLSEDPLVKERRGIAIASEFKHVITKQLTSSYRQELVRQYSLRSFGNMSIKG